MKRFRCNRVREAGYSLVEVLVAITLFVVVSAITGTLIVQANQTTRRATSAAFAQSQMQDAVLRISREVAVSDPIVAAKPNELETVTVRDGATVRTRFWYKDDGTGKDTGEIRSKSGASLDTGEITSGYTVVAKDVTDSPTPSQGGTSKILAYVDGNSRPVGNGVDPLTAEELPKVARVKINLNAILKDRSKPLTLVTSMGTRLGSPAGWGPPPPLPLIECPVMNPAARTPNEYLVDWGPVPFGTQQVHISRVPDFTGPAIKTFLPSTTSFLDTGLDPAQLYWYNFTATGPSGTSIVCPFDVQAVSVPSTPVVQAYAAGYNKNTITWDEPAPDAPDIDHYVVSRSDSATGTFTDVQTVPAPGTVWNDKDKVVSAKLGVSSYYRVQAFGTSTSTAPSGFSVPNVAVQYPDSPVTSAFKGRDVTAVVTDSNNLTDETNHVAWTTSTISPRYNVYWTRGPTDITATLANPTSRPTLLSADMTGAARGGRYSYWAVGENDCHNDDDDPQNNDGPGGTPAVCQSPNAPVEMGGIDPPTKVDVYQRPNAPTLAPGTLSDNKVVPSLATNLTVLDYTQNGDAGAATGDEFCDDAQTLCKYSLMRSREFATSAPETAHIATSYHVDEAYSLVMPLTPDSGSVADSNWGRTFDWTIKSWNKGGWSSASANERTLTYPGQFDLAANHVTSGYHLRTTNGNDDFRPYNHWLEWDTSAGTGLTYRYRIDAKAWHSYGTGKSSDNDDVDSRGTAGQQMTYTIEAHSANGKTRPNPYKVQLPPGTINYGKVLWECKPNYKLWRVAYKYVNLHTIDGPSATATYTEDVGVNIDGLSPEEGELGQYAGILDAPGTALDNTWDTPDVNGTYGTDSGGSHQDPSEEWHSLEILFGGRYGSDAEYMPRRGAFKTMWNEISGTSFDPDVSRAYSIKLAMGTTKDTDNAFHGCNDLEDWPWRTVDDDGDWGAGGTFGTNYPSQDLGYLEDWDEPARRMEMFPAPPTNAEDVSGHYQ